MDDKKLRWLGSSYHDLNEMPKPIVQAFGFQLGQVQNGLTPETATHLTHIEHGLWELKENHKGDTYRVMHLLRHENVIFVLHCFKKKSTTGKNIPKAEKETIGEAQGSQGRNRRTQDGKGSDMTSSHTTPAGVSVLDELDLDPEFVVKAKLAIRLTKTIAELKLTQREVSERTGLSQPRVSQITRGQLDEVSAARLEECLVSLGHDVTITVGPRHEGAGEIKVIELQAA